MDSGDMRLKATLEFDARTQQAAAEVGKLEKSVRAVDRAAVDANAHLEKMGSGYHGPGGSSTYSLAGGYGPPPLPGSKTYAQQSAASLMHGQQYQPGASPFTHRTPTDPKRDPKPKVEEDGFRKMLEFAGKMAGGLLLVGKAAEAAAAGLNSFAMQTNSLGYRQTGANRIIGAGVSGIHAIPIAAGSGHLDLSMASTTSAIKSRRSSSRPASP